MVVDGVMIPIIAVRDRAGHGDRLSARARVREADGAGESAPRIPSDVSARLERMEQAIDSIAVEVERISEGQRFTTKLLAERSGAPRRETSRRRCADVRRRRADSASVAEMPSVLIVDDEPNIRRMVGALLASEGYEVRDAADGADGRRARGRDDAGRRAARSHDAG